MFRFLVMLLSLLQSSAFTVSSISKLFKNADPKFVQESEFKHARVALLAVPTLLTMNAFGIEEPVKWLSTQDPNTQLTFFGSVGLVEAISLNRLGSNFFLKEDVTPGVFFSNVTKVNTEVELASGRIAMLVAASMLAYGS